MLAALAARNFLAKKRYGSYKVPRQALGEGNNQWSFEVKKLPSEKVSSAVLALPKDFAAFASPAVKLSALLNYLPLTLPSIYVIIFPYEKRGKKRRTYKIRDFKQCLVYA